MTKEELDELIDIIYSAVWNMCNEIACVDCHYYDHFNSVKDCPLQKLYEFAYKMQSKRK